MTLREPAYEQFLQKLERCLGSLEADERAEVIGDIRSHMSEAEAEGRSPDEVLAKLGEPRELARAFAVELTMQSVDSRWDTLLDSGLKIAGLLMIGSIPTLIVVCVLGSVGVAFLGAGLIALIASLLTLAGFQPQWISWSQEHPAALGLLTGPALLIGGALSLYGLYHYLKFVARLVTRAIPPRRENRP